MTEMEIDKRIDELNNKIQEITHSIKVLTDALEDARKEKARCEEIRIAQIGALLDDVIHHKENENDK